MGNEWILLNAHVSAINLGYLRAIKMTDKEQAENCLRRAEEMLKKDNSVMGWVGSLFSSRGAETADEASELFRKAGSRFRVAEMWKGAACLTRCGRCLFARFRTVSSMFGRPRTHRRHRGRPVPAQG